MPTVHDKGPLSDGSSLRSLLALILRRGSETVRPGAPANDGVLLDMFRRLKEQLEASEPLKQHPHVVIKWSYGKGRFSKVPWVAFLDTRETNTTRQGLYVVLLVRQDMSGIYLTFNQGVSVPKDELGDAEGRVWVHDAALLLRRQHEGLAQHGFSLDDKIDLHTDAGLGKDYEAAAIAYKLYERENLPTDTQFFADVAAVLDAYETYVSTKGSSAPAVGQRNEDEPADDDEPDDDDEVDDPAEPWPEPADSHAPRIVRIQPGKDAAYWFHCLDGGYICTGWDEVGDLSAFVDRTSFGAAFASRYGSRYAGRERLMAQEAAQLWTLRELQPGDKVIASRGSGEVLAVGTVLPPAYEWRTDREQARHTVRVQWDTAHAKPIPRQRAWASTTVTEVPEPLYRFIISDVVPKLDLHRVYDSFSAGLKTSRIYFGEQHETLVRAFVASLATKRFAILTGLSGSGKTQIALRFGDWLGEERCLLVPVRPDWTGAEALFGYVNALQPEVEGRRAWFVPEPLAFMLKAAADPAHPYLLILDEMNLAHVERYFADVLSGMESGKPCLPNLSQKDGVWRDDPEQSERIPLPDNLFIIGTVNVDETTYMFSPKVLDRANTFEFRVKFSDLVAARQKPSPCEPGSPGLVTGFLCIAADDDWKIEIPPEVLKNLPGHLETLHQILSEAGLEYGYRVYYESQRFATMLWATWNVDEPHVLDRIVLQKLLPRLHGTRQELEDTLCTLGRFCFDLTYQPDVPKFDPEKPPADKEPRLPGSFDKVKRMTRRLRINQFASFAE